MSTNRYCFHSLLYFLLPILAHSCPPHNYTCGNFTFEVRSPFYTPDTKPPCQGLHQITCINLVPVIQLHNNSFIYPLSNISYPDNSITVHDQKLGSYFHDSNCVFLYDFNRPLPRFNVLSLAEYLNSSQQLFNCSPNSYDYSHDAFKAVYNLSYCKDYSLYYSSDSEGQHAGDLDFPAYCMTSNDVWFDWRFKFEEDDGSVSLLSAGFSRKWTPFADCFSCRTLGGNCSGSSRCECSNECRGVGVQSGKDSVNSKVIAGLCVFLSSFFMASFILGYCYRRKISTMLLQKKNSKHAKTVEAFQKKNSKHVKTVEAFLEKYDSLATKRYTYAHVKKMTNFFSEKLGQGGFGSVYKGKLFDGHPVAVKVLIEDKGNGEDFINEVAAIGNTSHVNVVSLRGFCAEGSKRALIYDFMQNGSLEKHIQSEKLTSETSLGWEKLYEIAIGIARGLDYLHKGCKTQIVHFDIKPHNILLDEDFCPKISDFGMAKLYPSKQSITSTFCARGTIGYIAPEVFSRIFGVVSSKSDVYSYGMMLLEMFGGKRRMSSGPESGSEAYFPCWIYRHLENNNDLLEYGVTNEIEEIARKMLIVGFWCIQTMPENRPSIDRVVDMLEGSINDLPIPPKPVLSSPLDLVIDSCTTSSLCERL